MKVVKSKKKKYNFFFKLLILLVGGSSIVSLVGLQMSINSKRKEMKDLQEGLLVQKMKNNKLKDSISSKTSDNDEYVKKIARKRLDFAEQSERVFVVP